MDYACRIAELFDLLEEHSGLRESTETVENGYSSSTVRGIEVCVRFSCSVLVDGVACLPIQVAERTVTGIVRVGVVVCHLRSPVLSSGLHIEGDTEETGVLPISRETYGRTDYQKLSQSGILRNLIHCYRLNDSKDGKP